MISVKVLPLEPKHQLDPLIELIYGIKLYICWSLVFAVKCSPSKATLATPELSFFRDVSGVTLSTGKLQGVVISAIGNFGY